ncbi:MAG: rhamnogalacturonan acetylesterase [Paludibacteraceae bacterium]|nr:rhamnogalacturonan acetylesterase [Paludibacteraceae bacterium]
MKNLLINRANLFLLAFMAIFANLAFADNYTSVPDGTYDVGAAENPGGGKKFSEYPSGGMYLYQAPSGHSYSSGQGPNTGIYTIFSESGIVFHRNSAFDMTITLDVSIFAANENISAVLYSISETDYAAIYDGTPQSTEVLLNSKDSYEVTAVSISSKAAFQYEFSNIPAGFYFIVCSSTNLSNIVYFNQISFAASSGSGTDPQPAKKIRVHTIGDSTMADYDESSTDKRGWGMYLGSFFDPEFVTVNNRAKSGADTRQFYDGAAYWASVKSQMSEGDYLIIQFAHNDEGTVTYGMDNLEYKAYCEANGLPAPTDARGTNPQTTYRDFLRAYIDEARALGVTPILAGPICRRYFNGNDIKRSGRHDLGDSFSKIENGVLYQNQSVPADDHSMDYVYAMQVVAQEKNVPFINLTEATRQLYVSYGDAQSKELLFCTGDNTHTNAMGANLIARQAAQMLKESGILAEYISIPTSISANPTSIAIGETYSGVAQNKEFLLTGFGLEPATGTLTLTASPNILVSLDHENYAATASLNYAGGNLFQRVYIRALYTAEGAQTDSVVISSGNLRLVLPVTASVISLDGGSDVRAFWAIDAKPVPDPIVTGPISAEMTLQHMMAADTKSEFTDGISSDILMVRFHNANDAGAKTAWPANEIDENATRYIDFAVTAPATAEVRITGINLDIASHSTATMCYHLNTGFGDGFTDVRTLAEHVNMTNLAVEHLALTPALTIPAGETLHVRVLPWHNLGEEKSGKYICLKNVEILGKAFEPGDDPHEGIDEIDSSSLQGGDRGRLIYLNGRIYILRGDKTYTITGQETIVP